VDSLTYIKPKRGLKKRFKTFQSFTPDGVLSLFWKCVSLDELVSYRVRRSHPTFETTSQFTSTQGQTSPWREVKPHLTAGRNAGRKRFTLSYILVNTYRCGDWKLVVQWLVIACLYFLPCGVYFDASPQTLVSLERIIWHFSRVV
jgi:hypothetical protein